MVIYVIFSFAEINDIFTANGISTPIIEETLEDLQSGLRSGQRSGQSVTKSRESTTSLVQYQRDELKLVGVKDYEDGDEEEVEKKVELEEGKDNKKKEDEEEQDGVELTSTSPADNTTPDQGSTLRCSPRPPASRLSHACPPSSQPSPPPSSRLSDCDSVRSYILFGRGDAYSIVGDFCNRYAEFGIPSADDVAMAWDRASTVSGSEFSCENDHR